MKIFYSSSYRYDNELYNVPPYPIFAVPITFYKLFMQVRFIQYSCKDKHQYVATS